MKELGHDRKNSLEMMRARGSFPLLGEDAWMHRHDWRRGVHASLGRSEENVHASFLGKPGVFFERSRITLKVLAGSELKCVDEDAHHNEVTAALRLIHEREMTFMKRAHCRHECDSHAFQTRFVRGGNHFLNRVDRAHYWKL